MYYLIDENVFYAKAKGGRERERQNSVAVSRCTLSNNYLLAAAAHLACLVVAAN